MTKLDKTNKIVIVGGGSAGWMTAAMLVKAFPNKNITVIDSDDYATVGVGESTIPNIKEFARFIGIDESEFLKETNGSYKLSIKFTDFYEKDSGSFYYPFGQPVSVDYRNPFFDWSLKQYYYPDTPVDDCVKSLFAGSHLFINNKFSQNLNGEFDNFNPANDVAYHFDAKKFGMVLKNKYCINRGVVHKNGTIVSIQTGEQGIEYLLLKNEEKVFADIFIDCTGFKSLLLGGALAEPFKSYEYILPNNSAIAAQIPYENKETELEGYTNCTAIENGWVWNIPLWSRLGTGYVYSNKFVSKEDALEEYKNYLTSNKMTVPRTRKQVDSLDYKYIDMRIGIHERTFVKNVVAIGLAAGFIEPLESSGLYTVHDFIFKLITILAHPKLNQYDKDIYNKTVFDLFHNFAEFVSLHYLMSKRDDTPYWQAATSRSIDIGKTDKPEDTLFCLMQNRYMITWEHPSNFVGLAVIATGQNYNMLSDFKVRYMEYWQDRNFKEELNPVLQTLEHLRDKWSKNAENAPTLYAYLKQLHEGVE